MFTVPVLCAIVARTGFDNVTMKRSMPSFVMLPHTGTLMLSGLAPVKVNVPDLVT